MTRNDAELQSTPGRRPGRRLAVRVVTVVDGVPTAEDLVLDHAAAAARFGIGSADVMFDDANAGTLGFTPAEARQRYGPAAAALIYPGHPAGDQQPLKAPTPEPSATPAAQLPMGS